MSKYDLNDRPLAGAVILDFPPRAADLYLTDADRRAMAVPSTIAPATVATTASVLPILEPYQGVGGTVVLGLSLAVMVGYVSLSIFHAHATRGAATVIIAVLGCLTGVAIGVILGLSSALANMRLASRNNTRARLGSTPPQSKDDIYLTG